jgi:hypothetical protein
MSDPQFGMYTKNAGFEHEIVNFEFAIASANRLKPVFGQIKGARGFTRFLRRGVEAVSQE